MKKNFTFKLLALAMCLGCAWGTASAEEPEIPIIPDRVFINDFAINPGETQLMEVWLENTVPWEWMYAKFELPKGLEMAAIDEGELPDDYTFDVDASMKGYERMVALSKNFANHEFWDKEKIGMYEDEEPGHYSPYMCQIGYSTAPGFLITGIWGHFFFNGTYQIALMKVKANDEFTEDGVIKMVESFFWCPSKDFPMGGALGSEDHTQVSGEPTVARVKRRTPTAITDIEAQPAQAGDGLYYNLMGQPVAHPAAGIYIHNGKKVVVK